ncbi:class I SAM-dependent methyltransferase [Mycolicibacterium fallax]|uniref:SAM-dependent methyltransferase n=1 Tax=Mycolicibacterium fallax TaxID=1793 RepID=A0A1X1R006_MYCFA|nr:class I SAM-dependent methyltransferase [Mycolicibacterium fallax]ORU97261.1 SAM-dependent methyltransferase [Mycolicibacterium fallax]BBY97846.1 hypothetical protein MFAL_13130 [Mycolicibacterium fallax]HOW94907.1 class I SAM-dependent methyltransferase [Mycolicibacterium fallax]HSA40084.1 class I SAM-dependent methyltransferase [Mycobacterium sp.]
MTESDEDARTAWERRYGESDRIWSGRVNARLAEIAGELTPGRALDLGAGEGADAIWLASRGWQVVAVDVSETALARGAADAGQLAARIDFRPCDLNTDFPDGEFDLVSAQFLHSHADLDRERILRRAAAAIAPGGTLLIVDHGEAPPWASALQAHHHEFPSAQRVLDGLELGQGWQVLRCGSAERDAVGPDGQPAHLVDNVIVVRRGQHGG